MSVQQPATMDLSLFWQYLVIGLAVLLSLAVVVRKRAPGLERRMRAALALWLLRPGRAAGLQRLGRWIAPPPAGNAGSCGGCNDCGPAPRQKR